MSDDTPTERFTPPEPAAAERSDPAVPSKTSRSKLLIIGLSALGALLLVAVVVLLSLLASRNTDVATPAPTNSTSSTPKATASASPSEAPPAEPSAPPAPTSPPVSTGPVFDSFSPKDNTSVGCTGDTGEVPLTFTWTSIGATEAAIGVGTLDAYAGLYESGLPASGSFSGLSYQCGYASQIYTVSIRGVSGQTNKTITLTR